MEEKYKQAFHSFKELKGLFVFLLSQCRNSEQNKCLWKLSDISEKSENEGEESLHYFYLLQSYSYESLLIEVIKEHNLRHLKNMKTTSKQENSTTDCSFTEQTNGQTVSEVFTNFYFIFGLKCLIVFYSQPMRGC